MFDEDPESEDFVLTRKVNLHENQRHREDFLDQVGGRVSSDLIQLLIGSSWLAG